MEDSEYQRPPSQVRRKEDNGLALLTYLLVALFCLALSVLAAALVAYVLLQPRIPRFQVKSVSIPSSAANDVDKGIVFTLTNPNDKLQMRFRRMNLRASLDGIEIGDMSSSNAAFSLGKQKSRDFIARLPVLGEQAATKAAAAIAQDVPVRLHIDFTVRIYYDAGFVKSPPLRFVARCNLKVELGSGNVLEQSCNPHLL